MTRRELPRRLPVAAWLFAVVPLGLSLQTACEAVDPGEQSHTAFTGPAYLTVGGELTGAHAQIACEGCHVGETAPFGPVPDNCITCHWSDYQALDGGHPIPLQNDVASCNEGCHRVVDTCWNYLTNPACTGGPVETDTDTDTDVDTDTDTDVDTDTGTIPTGNSCAIGGCHGNGPIRDDAAPASSSHNAHLATNYALWSPASPLGCDTCHPAGGAEAVTHADDTVNVTLEGIVVGDNTAATFSGGTCSGTYCHGAGMADAPVDPVWDAGPSAVSCGSTCHVSPPTNMYDSMNGGAVTGHPPFDTCSTCHAPTGGGDASTLADKTTHINGTVEL
jgi:predicted CxxxxCH...CXXCH cytochrome family protein